LYCDSRYRLILAEKQLKLSAKHNETFVLTTFTIAGFLKIVLELYRNYLQCKWWRSSVGKFPVHRWIGIPPQIVGLSRMLMLIKLMTNEAKQTHKKTQKTRSKVITIPVHLSPSSSYHLIIGESARKERELLKWLSLVLRVHMFICVQ